MTDLIRNTAAGQLLRFVTRNAYLSYPEEKPDFILPAHYRTALEKDAFEESSCSEDDTIVANTRVLSPQHSEELVDTEAVHRQLTHPEDLEKALVPATVTAPTSDPQKQTTGTLLVDFYDADDAANPQNWSLAKKSFATVQIWYDHISISYSHSEH